MSTETDHATVAAIALAGALGFCIAGAAIVWGLL
jgi:hypothetical protein